MDHTIDTIMLYTFNNGALTWYCILTPTFKGRSKSMLNSFQYHHNHFYDLRA